MPITNGYATLNELKARLGISDTDADTILENVIEAVSRWIDSFTARRFYAVSETRYYTAEWPDLLLLGDDLLSVTTLKTDDDGDRVYETTWASTDYDLEPYNATLDGKPYTQIRITPNGRYTFPGTRRGVEIAGSFGYAATTPDVVNEACLLQSERIYKRKDAPFGVTGAPEVGISTVIPRLDPDVRTMLEPLRKMHVGAI